MKISWNLQWAFVLVLTLFSCDQFRERQILGNWKAVEIQEDKVKLDLDLGKVELNFSEESRYSYKGNLNYSESGTFEIKDQFLITQDTTLNGAAQKLVEITLLTGDSLILKMEENQKERILKFVREK